MAQSTDPLVPPMPSFGKKQKQEVAYDLVRPGQGTPWENRGNYGVVGAYLRTAVRSMTRPALLLDHIRDTTVTKDANIFAWICCAMWGVSVLINEGIAYARLDPDRVEIFTEQYVIIALIKAVAVTAFAYGMFQLAASLFHKLVSTEITGPLPMTLTFSIIGYTTGPSLLAPIPFHIGWGLAFVFFLVAMIAAARKRLFITWRGAIINSFLIFVAVAGLSAALYFVGPFLVDLLPLRAYEEIPGMEGFPGTEESPGMNQPPATETPPSEPV